jgi:NADH-quinone oxidoreductase subunit E
MRDQIHEILSSFRTDRSQLIPILQRVQEKLTYLPEEAISGIARYLNLTENEVLGVASFYAQFRFTRPGDHIIKVCSGTACHVRGGESLLQALQTELQVTPGGMTEDGKFSLEQVACLGCCALSPVMVINDDPYGKVSSRKLKQILDIYRKG